MNQPQERHQKEEIQPFFSVWLHPKKTAQYLIDHKKWTYALIFLVLGGIAEGITGLEDTKIYPTYPTWIMLVACILLGPFIAAISVSVSAFIIWLVGKMFGGKGKYEELFKVTTLTSIPIMSIAPFMLLWMANSPETYFNTDIETSSIVSILEFISALVYLVVGVWSFVINIAGVATAHQFSNWKAFFTIIIPAIIFVALIIGITVWILSKFGAL